MGGRFGDLIMPAYKLIKDPYYGKTNAVRITRDNGIVSTVPFDPLNRDYQEYLEWINEGNTPEASD